MPDPLSTAPSRAPLTLNAGYTVRRVDPHNKYSQWSIFDPEGNGLYACNLRYSFWSKKEALLFLRQNNIEAILASERQAEEERRKWQERATRIHAHACYPDYWTLKGTEEAIAAEIKRLDQSIARSTREPTVQTLREVQERLEDARLVAHTAAQTRWEIILGDVDGKSEES